eukprot:scaffold36188_cov54-Attheya_sp.AAC.4
MTEPATKKHKSGTTEEGIDMCMRYVSPHASPQPTCSPGHDRPKDQTDGGVVGTAVLVPSFDEEERMPRIHTIDLRCQEELSRDDEIAVSSPDQITSVPKKNKREEELSKWMKLKVPELKDILLRNHQHVTGRKAFLVEQIIDGEKYGQLPHCPECGEGRLKVLEYSPDTIFCPGYYDGVQTIPCGYWCPSSQAPRDGPWISYPTVIHQDKTRQLFQRKKVSDLKKILRTNEQHVTGTKNVLLDRIVDGYLHGRLDHCPKCTVGRLRIEEMCPELVRCHGHYELGWNIAVPCSFECATKDAPRSGPWIDV